MFHKNPFTIENAKSLSTIMAGISALAGVQVSIDPSADPRLQVFFYLVAIALFFLKERQK